MALSPKMQFEEVARTYLKSVALGDHPKRSLAEIGRTEFGLSENEIDSGYLKARRILRKIGIPTIQEELASPCHAYPSNSQ